ncbi:hypothetical protein SCACP_21430 [Sporomusa carbonis]|uniref:head decoration protein n=1 Tax=Sporomusa carbonis TaxID=3076075 RepID=UPI003A758F74
MAELVNTVDTYEYDGLIAGTDPAIFTANEIIATGTGVLPRGRVLGKVTATGKLVSVDSTKTDGSEKPYAILAYPVDATSADVVATVYKSGVFNREKLSFGGTDTASQHEDALRDLNIYLTSVK